MTRSMHFKFKIDVVAEIEFMQLENLARGRILLIFASVPSVYF